MAKVPVTKLAPFTSVADATSVSLETVTWPLVGSSGSAGSHAVGVRITLGGAPLMPVSSRLITVPSGNVSGSPDALVGPAVQLLAWVRSMVPVWPSGAVQVMVTVTGARIGSSGSTPENCLMTSKVPSTSLVEFVITAATVVPSPMVSVAVLPTLVTPVPDQPSKSIDEVRRHSGRRALGDGHPRPGRVILGGHGEVVGLVQGERLTGDRALSRDRVAVGEGDLHGRVDRVGQVGEVPGRLLGDADLAQRVLDGIRQRHVHRYLVVADDGDGRGAVIVRDHVRRVGRPGPAGPLHPWRQVGRGRLGERDLGADGEPQGGRRLRRPGRP